MKRTLIFLAHLLICVQGIGQPAGFYVNDLKPAHLKNKFPVVHSDFHPEIAEKINLHLQLGELEHLPGDSSVDHPFQKVGRDTHNWGPHINYHGYTVYKTEFPIVSITLEGTGIGLSAIDFWFNINFNSLNGEIIHLSDILSDSGMTQIGKHFDSLFPFNEPHEVITDFIARGDSLIIKVEGERADGNSIDGTPDSRKAYSKKQVQPFLSKYGKALLDGIHTSYRSKAYSGALYSGVVGRDTAHLYIDTYYDDGSILAYFWYADKKLINLSGNHSDEGWSFYHHIDLDEDEYRYIRSHQMELKGTNHLIGTMDVGNWQVKVNLKRQ